MARLTRQLHHARDETRRWTRRGVARAVLEREWKKVLNYLKKFLEINQYIRRQRKEFLLGEYALV